MGLGVELLLRRWTAAYAAATATTASYEAIRDAATGGEGDGAGTENTILPIQHSPRDFWAQRGTPCSEGTPRTRPFLRTRGSRHEVDLIAQRQDQRVVAIEVKLSAAIADDDVTQLLWLREQIGQNFIDGVVISAGSHAYRRQDGTAVVPAAPQGP